MEEQQSIYFTPRLADFRVDYICEYLEDSSVDDQGNLIEKWTEKKFVGGDILPSMEDASKYRTRYLKYEEIAAQGWKDDGVVVPLDTPYQDLDARKFSRGNYSLIYYMNQSSITIYLQYREVFAIIVQGFRCPSFNELVYLFHSVEFNNES